MQKHTLYILCLFCFIFPIMAIAGGWYEQPAPLVSNAINKITTQDLDGNLLFAAGDGGMVLMSKDGGHSWDDISQPAIFENLNDILVYYGSPDTILVAVGDNGTILRSNDFGFSWAVNDTMTNANLNAVAYDYHLGILLIGGDDSGLLTSDDQGNSWTRRAVEGAMMQIREIIPTSYGIYISAFRNDTTFVQTNGDSGIVFSTENILPDIILNRADEIFSNLYFAGYRVSTSEGIIYQRYDADGSWDIPQVFTPPGIGAPITDIKGMASGQYPLWISTRDGRIYESDASATNFFMVYDNGTGEEVRSIATSFSDSPRSLAWAGGTNGLLIKYDFAVVLLSPSPNQFIPIGQNFFEIRFSAIPLESSLYNGIHLHSSVQGDVGYTVEYQADSTYINIIIDPGAGTIPGEEWTIILRDQILEQGGTSYLKPYHYNVYIGPAIGANLNFSTPQTIHTIGGPTTNYITGFFDNDDSFDIITFARDSLICYHGIGDGTFAAPVSIYIGTTVSVNTTIKEQLHKADINRDGLLDLYLFDDSGVRLIQNTSTSVLSFVPSAYLSLNNIRDAKLYYADDDNLFDMVIVGDTLTIRTGITLSFFGSVLSETDGMGWQQIEIADIDLDGHDDFVAINSTGDLIFRHNQAMGGYDNEISFNGPFQDVILSDLDYDGDRDIIAQRDQELVTYYYQPFWNFPPGPTLTQESAFPVRDVTVTDLNGDYMPDVIMATDNQFIKLFRNISPTQDVLAFTEETINQITTDIAVNRLTFGDYDQEGTTDLVATNPDAGDFQLVLKGSGQTVSWQPVIDSVGVVDARVFLRWTQFPDSLGTFDFYRLYHDTLSYSFMNYTDIFNQADTTFIDSTVTPGRTRWYRVEAYFSGGTVSFASEEVSIDVFNILDGSISGTLGDAKGYYFVPNHIQVDAGQSLTIMPRVKVLFDSSASFDVFGSLVITGSEEQMVGFTGKENHLRWQGINFHPGADTVRISWFYIEDAIRAFSIYDRPVKFNLGAVQGSDTGFNLTGAAYLSLKNIFIAENLIGIDAFENSSVDLINLTIVENSYEGIHTSDNAQVKGRNMIVWNNNFGDAMIKGPDIRNNSSQVHILRYSTIDSLSGSYDLFAIQHLQPLFKPAGQDSMQYIPDELSPTIDAGDPSDDFSLEPAPNGGRINQGVYGGLHLATPSLQPRLFVDSTAIHLSARIGETDSYPLKLYNRGYVDLLINAIDLFIPEFYLNDLTFPLMIPPGDSGIVEINFSPMRQSIFPDTMYIRSTDKHYSQRGLKVILEGSSLEGPKFTAALDTLIYTYLPFSYQVKTDLGTNQNYIFLDNTPLFDIDSLSGLIQFTPRRGSVGQHMVIITLRPVDLITEPEQDTLLFDIRLNPVNPPLNFTATAEDQKITLRWDNPDNRFYTRTKLSQRLRNENNEWGPAVLIADTMLTRNTTTTYIVANLAAGGEYRFDLNNYYAPAALAGDAPVSSTTLTVIRSTPAPNIKFDLSASDIYVPPGDTLNTRFKIKNDGDGSLYMKFMYQADSLTNLWFFMDTTQKHISPHDSLFVNYSIHPLYTMEEKTHRLSLQLTTNQREWQLRTTDILLHILFDRIAPRLTMVHQPEDKHTYSAVRFDFTARDDTLIQGWQLGDSPEQLRLRYRFSDLQSGITTADTGLTIQPLDFYPLIDGRYRFELWIYDREGNGYNSQSVAFTRQFEIKASVRTFGANQWYLSSIPRHQQMHLNTFFNDSSAHVFRWNSAQKKYIPYADSILESGEGLWILTTGAKEINVNGYDPVSKEDSTLVTLRKGWNQIGVPVAYPVDFGTTRIISGSNPPVSIDEAIRAQLISPAIYWYHSVRKFSGYEWAEMDTAKVFPWQGYWVNAAQACRLIIRHKPALEEKVITRNAKLLVKDKTSFNWQLNLQAVNEMHRDIMNIIGCTNNQKTLPVYEPPPLDSFCSLSFSSMKGALTRDLRSPFVSVKEVKEWNLVISTSDPALDHTISWSKVNSDRELYLYLVDQNRERIIDLSLDSLYTFKPNQKQYVLKLYATQDAGFKPELIPLTFRLGQNYPNPFNPVTTIKYGIPQAGAGKNTTLIIYNILGQKITTLVNKKLAAGYHTVEWNGTNRQGNRVATGIYFYRLRSGSHMLVKKMILLK